MDKKQMPGWPGWETVRLIGRGSFGAVYEIRRQVFDVEETAALKVISIPQRENDIDEMYNDGYDDASISKTLREHLRGIVSEYSLMRKMSGCPNVVGCNDLRYEEHPDGRGWDVYIRMELLTPLTRVLPARIPENMVVRIAKDLCHALIECERLDILHRDIKPQNIFLSERGEYKLGDFGIAKIVERTSGGTKIGTYKYMAPEIHNSQPYGQSSDIYSLGMVLYWLLNERRMPFVPLPPTAVTAGMEEEAKQRRISGETLPEPKNGSEMLKRIVAKACAFNPKARFTSACDMLRELELLEPESETETTVSRTVVSSHQYGERAVVSKAVPKPTSSPEAPKETACIQETPAKKSMSMPVLAGGILALALFLIIGICIGRATGNVPPAANTPGETSAIVLPELPPEVPAPAGNQLRSDKLELVSGYAYSWIDEASERSVLGSAIMRNKIKTVTFCDSLENMASDAWDVSSAGDGSVMAWVVENSGLYDLFIGAEGGVNAGQACADLFAGYTNLEQVMFSNCFHTDGAVDMSRMFFGCSKLEQIDGLRFDTSHVTDMSRMFFHCTALRQLDLSHFDTSSVETMAYMFWRCFALTELDLSSFDTAAVQNMGGMFEWCMSLRTLDLSNFNTSSVRNMAAMFSYCMGLRSLNLGHFDTANVDTMEDMFSNCEYLEILDISSFRTGNVTSTSEMFFNCKELRTLDVSGFDTSNIETMDRMFSWCLNLKNLDLSSFNTASAEDMTEMFYCCPGVELAQVLHFNTQNVTRSENFMNGKGSEWKDLFR